MYTVYNIGQESSASRSWKSSSVQLRFIGSTHFWQLTIQSQSTVGAIQGNETSGLSEIFPQATDIPPALYIQPIDWVISVDQTLQSIFSFCLS